MAWILHVFTLDLRRYLSYRVDFWISLLGHLFAISGVSYFLWKSIYASEGVDTIGGFSFQAMILYYLLVPVSDRLVFGADRGGLSMDIYDGGLTRYLIYPVPIFLYKYLSKLAYATVAILQYFLVLGAFFWFADRTPDAPVSPGSIFLGVGFCLAAGIVYFTFQAILEMIAFWADNVWSLLAMLRFVTALLGGAFIPVSFFPPWLAEVVGWLPFPYFTSVPIQLTMGRLGMADALHGLKILAVWQLICGVLVAWVWSRGTRRYTGVGM